MAKKEKTIIKQPQRPRWIETWYESFAAYWLGALFLLIPLIFSRAAQSPAIDIKWLLLEIGVFVLGSAWILNRWMNREKLWNRSPLNFAVLLYFGVFTIAQFLPTNYSYLLNEWLQFSVFILIYLLAIQTFHTPEKFKITLHGLLLGGLLVSVYVLLQKAGLDPVSWEKTGDNLLNIPGSLGNSNLLGWYLSALFPVSLGFLFTSSSSPSSRNMKYSYPIVILLAMSVANNRAGWVALITASLFFFFLMIYKKKASKEKTATKDVWDKLYDVRKALLAGVIIVAVAGSVVLWQHYSSRSDVAIKGRFLHWKTSMAMVKDTPWFGQGPGNYFTTYLTYQGNVLHDPANIGFLRVAREVQSMNAEYAHNEYIQALTDTGIFGFLSFMMVVVMFIWMGYLQFRHLKSPEYAGLYLGCFTGGLALLSASKFGFPLHVPVSGMVFWFLLGSVGAIGNWETESLFRSEFWPEWITGRGIIKLTRTTFFLVIITVLWIIFIGWGLPKAYLNYQCSVKIREGRYYAETLGDMNQAVNSMEQAIQSDHTSGLAHYFLGGYYAKQERYQDAIREYNQATSNYNDQRIYYNLAQIYFNLKDFAKAEEHYKMTLWLNDRNAMSYRQLGLIYASRNDYPVSLEYFKRYLSLQSQGPEAEAIKDLVRQIETVMKSAPAADTTGGNR